MGTFANGVTMAPGNDCMTPCVRQRAGRQKHPTAGALDSQSVKTTQVAEVRGFDSGKRVKGRKRHILVDTLGLLLAVVVTSAALSDPAGARLLLRRLGGAWKKTASHLGRWNVSWTPARVGPATLPLCFAARLAQRGAKRLCPAPTALGGGTHFCLAHAMSTPELGL